jgi:catechol 2,3-dioxygenase-like lactoylglutathione lyase family enzyme
MRTRTWGLVVVSIAMLAACREAATLPQPVAAGGGATPAGAAGGTPSAAGGTGAIPSAASGPFLGGAGIGVADLEKSFDFYTNVVGMTLRYELPVPGYVNEKILYFKDSKGSDVVLMNFIDGRPHNYLNNPVKIVFYVPSASALIEKIRARGLQIIAEPAPQAAFNNTVIAFARDPDGYILEIIEQPGTVPYLGAIGIGVADLEKAKDFYTRVLGMVPMGGLLQVPGVWDEWILQYPGGKGSAVVLLHYTDGREHNYLNVPVKTVHFVPDARATTSGVEKEGLAILSQPMNFTVQGVNALISLARDPDGYVVELVTTQ